MSYDIERSDNGEVKIWVLGKSAYYQIFPSREYKPIFKQMREKAILWVFLEDTYEVIWKTRKKFNIPVRKMCQDYFLDDRSYCTDLAGAEAVFRKHHLFLILMMLQAAPPANNRWTLTSERWKSTDLYKLFEKDYPQSVRQADQVIKQLQAQTRFTDSEASDSKATSASEAEASSSTPRHPVKQPRPELTSTQTMQKVKIGPPGLLPSTVPKNSPARRIHSFLEQYIGACQLDPRLICLDKMVDTVFENFEFENRDQAEAVMRVRAWEFIILMETSTRYQWVNRSVYNELQVEAASYKVKKPDREKELLAIRCAQRIESLKGPTPMAGSTASVKPADARAIPAATPGSTSKPRRTSGRVATKQQSNKRSAGISIDLDSDTPTTPETMTIAAKRRKTAGKGSSSARTGGKSALRPALTSTSKTADPDPDPESEDDAYKYEYYEIDSDDYATDVDNDPVWAAAHPFKRKPDSARTPLEARFSRVLPIRPSSPQPPTAAAAGGLQSPSLSLSRSQNLPRTPVPKPRQPPPPPESWPSLKAGRGRPPVIVKRMLTTASNLPGGHWRCELDRCGHVIVDANTREGRLLVERHYIDHGKKMKEAMAAVGLKSVRRNTNGPGGVE